MSLTIILPCLNEEANVLTLTERVSAALTREEVEYEVLLIDDGSSDATWERIETATRLGPGNRIRGIRHASNQGIFASWQTGVREARCDYVCFMDSDLQNPPEALPIMWRLLGESRCDLVQGTRSSIEWDRDGRYWSSRVLNTILNIVYGDSASDNKSGFLMGPRAVLEDVLALNKKYRFPQTFIRIAARSKGYTVEETETLFFPRRSGQSFLARRNAFIVYMQVLIDIAKGLGEFSRGLGRPTESTVIPHVQNPNRPNPRYRGLRRLRFEIYFATMPLHAWLIRRSVRNIYLELQGSQWMHRDKIRELQTRKLRRLIQHAYSHVPYYRTVMDRHGLVPADLQDLRDLANFPMLEKDDVRKNLYFDLFSDTHRKHEMHKISTSGSTGEPFVVYGDRFQLEVRFATTLRALEWTGWRFGDRQMRLWHQKLGMSSLQAAKERIDAWLLKRRFVPAFELTEESHDRLIKEINRHKPVLIDGYAESLNFLAQLLATQNHLEHTPNAVMSSAQVLTDQVRTQIESEFGCRVVDKYGAREFSGIAYQCEAGQDHHVMDESYVVELLTEGRPSKPGEVGEIVITDLNNFSVPLIRYRIGDLAIAVDNDIDCRCGRGLSRIGAIQGRTQALVHCANGRWLPGTFFAHFFKDYDYLVSCFQIHQVQHGAFLLRIVKGPQWNPSTWNSMMEQLRMFVGSTEVEVVYVSEIPLLRTGKRSPVISDIKLDFQALNSEHNKSFS